MHHKENSDAATHRVLDDDTEDEMYFFLSFFKGKHRGERINVIKCSTIA